MSSSSIPKARAIRPTAKSITMDESEAQHTLQKVQSAIAEIHQHNASHLSYEELYRLSYNMVMHKHGRKLFDTVKECMRLHFAAKRQELHLVNDSHFLHSLADLWRDHVREISMVADIVMYLDKSWIPLQQDLESITELGHKLFREEITENDQVAPRVLALVLDTLKRHRMGEWMDLETTKAMFRMFAELGSVDTSLEQPFLAQTEEFYSGRSLQVLTNSTCYEYLLFAEEKLKEEARLAQLVFPDMEDRLNRLVLRELIVKHSKALVEMPMSGFLYMVIENKVEELRLLFALLEDAMGTTAFGDCAKMFFDYVRESGSHILHDDTLTVSQCIEQLMEEKRRYDFICKTSFKSNKLFSKAIKEAFEAFMNVTVKCASYLATYTDELLTGKLKCDSEAIDSQLDQVMGLFRYLSDKDVFEEYYKVNFSKRLLAQRSQSHDFERSMILKMKTECGHQFTSKLEGMFRDMAVSKQTCAQFTNEYPIAFTAQVLTSGYWPTTVHPSFQSKLPREMLDICRDFEQFYLAQHNGRRIQWNHMLGSCEVKAVGGFNSGEQHEFVVSPLQCILMLHLQNSRVTFGKLQELTEIPREELKRQLISMCVNKFNIFNKLHGSNKQFADEDEYEFNRAFKSKQRKITVKMVVMTRQDSSAAGGAASSGEAISMEEHSTLPGFVSEQRNYLMDACIVRVMKSRKRMDHNQLITEVLQHLRFKPVVQDLKKRIEALIEREYLERDQADPRMYQYLA